MKSSFATATVFVVDGTVSMIDTATNTVARTFKVGKGPNGVTFRPVN